jgi:hypothetical protein
VPGRARQRFSRDLNGIINLDAKISNRALDLQVPQQLHGTEIAGSPVKSAALGSTQGVHAELE